MGDIGDLLSTIKFGKKQSYKNITLFPIIGNDYKFECTTLSEGITQEKVAINEVVKENLNKINILNCSLSFLMIIEGEEIIGDKSNYMVTESILLPPKSAHSIPISSCNKFDFCVFSRQSGSCPNMAPNSLRGILQRNVSLYKFLKTQNYYQDESISNWKDLIRKRSSICFSKKTKKLTEIFLKNNWDMCDFLDHFSLLENQIGYVSAINGSVISMEIFGTRYARYHYRIVEGIGFDAIYSQKKTNLTDVRHRAAKSFISRLIKMEWDQYKGFGTSKNIRATILDITAAALVLDSRLVHLSAYLGGSK